MSHHAVNKNSSEDNQIAAELYIKWLLEDSTIFEDEEVSSGMASGAVKVKSEKTFRMHLLSLMV